MRIAAVDIGTNSTRLLVAEVDAAAGRVEELTRLTTVTRLGEGVDRNGRLLDAAIDRVAAACRDYRAEIDRLGAERTVAVLTSAVRDAANGEALRELLSERFGFDARTISGEREARLTYLGAGSGRPAWDGSLLVIDIGGGSTEYVVGNARPDRLPRHHADRLGALHRAPPAERSTDSGRAGGLPGRCSRGARRRRSQPRPAPARTTPSPSPARRPRSRRSTSELVPYDRSKVHRYRLSRERCGEILDLLASLPLSERRELAGLHPDRAPTIVAGGVILLESLDAFGLDSVEVSESDILDGAVLDAAAEGKVANNGL